MDENTMRKSNYDIMKEQMRREFLKYDQQMMIERFGLKADDRYLYVRFTGRWYRLDRHSGAVEWEAENGRVFHEAEYGEVMTIYDVLCYAKPGCHLSGRYTKAQNLPQMARVASMVGNGFFMPEAGVFDGRTEQLARACEAIGGAQDGVGDLSYRLPLFDFLPVRFRFWESDEDFPANIQLMWDENILDYMHFETTYYASGHIMRRLREIVERYI